GDGPELTDAQRELKRLGQQRATLQREEQRLIDAYQVGAVELDELHQRRQRLREAGQQVRQREQVVAEQVAQAQRATTLAETVEAFCARLGAQLTDPTFETKQQILRLVVERIVVTDEEIVIQHIIPGDDTSRLYPRPGHLIIPRGYVAETLGDRAYAVVLLVCQLYRSRCLRHVDALRCVLCCRHDHCNTL
ncbi:MAG TPA: hypothetical protein VLA19_01600, partial [Herpetosiphonaceae bacterium]|nr:hypothetical protein [Herpetosiphonaceae bacterium]